MIKRIFLTGLFCTVVACTTFFAWGFLQQKASYVLYPFLYVQNSLITPVKQLFARKKTVQELEQKVKLLEAEREDLLASIIQLQSQITYAQDIQELLDFKQHYNHQNALIAHVLVKHFNQQAQFFLVDRGSNHGVAINMPVIYKNCLLGRIQEVYPLYSKVVLVTDKTCKVAAYCSYTNAVGIHEGINNSNESLLAYVSHLEKIDEHDLVLSSGQGLVFPRGFALGKVSAVVCNDVTQTATVRPLVSYDSIHHVMILPLKVE